MKRGLSVLLCIVMLMSILPAFPAAHAGQEDTVAASEMQLNDTIEFGMWPYGVMNKDSRFSNIAVTLKPVSYLTGSFNGTISAGDFNYLGDTYRKVVFTKAKSSTQSTYYFKWTSIKWKVCARSEQGVLLIARDVVDATPYCLAEEACSYEDSIVFQWLKEDFLKNAFSDYEKDALNTFTRFGVSLKASIPALSDYELGGMLQQNGLAQNIATGYPALTAGIRYAPSFSNCSSNSTVLTEQGTPAYVNTVGTAYEQEAVPAMLSKSNGIRPIVQLNAGARVYFDVSRYFLAPHEHLFNRKAVSEETFAKAGDCYHNDRYYYSCAYCDAVSESETFEDENSATHAPLAAIVSDEAFVETDDNRFHTGLYYYTCQTCGQVIKTATKHTKADMFSHVIPHEHQFVYYRTIEPTCENEGVKVYKCNICFTEEKREVYAPALSHAPEKVKDEKALCKLDKENNTYYYYYTCSRCGKVLNEAVLGTGAPTFAFDAAHEHVYRLEGEYEPTCTERGYKLYRCEICAQTEYEYTSEALGHELSYHSSSQRDTNALCSVNDYYKCSRCNKNVHVTGQHDYSKKSGTLYADADCSHAALYYLSCSHCGDKNRSFTYTVGEKKEHELVKNISEQALKTPASDTENARYYYTCKICGEVIKDTDAFEYQPDSDEHFHRFQLTDTVEAKCGNARTLTGKKVYTCACGETFTVKTPPKAHTKGNVVYRFGKTCINPDVVQYTCTACGETVVEREGEPLGHDFSKIGSCLSQATCYCGAKYRLECSRCGTRSLTLKYTDTESILPHTMQLVQTIEPSCEAEGSRIYKCQNCTQSYTESFGEPIGHKDTLTDTIEPTCTEAGKYIYRCEACGREKTESFGEPLGHSGSYVRSHLVTDKIREDTYKCERCGESYIETVEHKHVFDTPSEHIAKPATCYANAVAYYNCSDCLAHGIRVSNSAFTYELEGTQLTHVPQRVVGEAALRSERSATEPATYYFTCAHCGDVLKEGEYENRYFSTGDLGHEHRYFCEVLQRVGCTQNGIMSYTCQICGYSFEEVYQLSRGGHVYRTQVKFAGDCTRRAYTLYKCMYCMYPKIEYTGDEAPGHQYTVQSDKLYKAATCTDNALYYLACSACGDVSNEHIYEKEDTALQLEHIKTQVICPDALRSKGSAAKNPTYYYTCSHCGDILKSDDYGYFTPNLRGSALKDYPTGTAFELGRWPQTLVKDSALLESLNAKKPVMYRYGYGYGISEVLKRIDESTDYCYNRFDGYIDMSYGDIVLGGEKYRKVVIKHARVEDNDWEVDEERDALFGGTYYFKWEPIQWTVLQAKGGEVTVLSELILDYTYTMRENENDADWLNGCFYASAFTDAEKALIASKTGCFKLSFDEVKANASFIYTQKNGYTAPVSHYAQVLSANRAFLGEERDNAYAYWQSYDASKQQCRYIPEDIAKSKTILDSARLSEIGIRPAMVISADFVPGEAQAADTSCTHEHHFVRKMITAKSILKAADGGIYDDVKYSCICCGEVSTGEAYSTISSVDTYSAYDINRDGLIDIADISVILAHIGEELTNERFDYNANGTVDMQDVSILLLSEHYG